MGFLGIIALCYLVEILLVKPEWSAVAPAIIIPRIDHKRYLCGYGYYGGRWLCRIIFFCIQMLFTVENGE